MFNNIKAERAKDKKQVRRDLHNVRNTLELSRIGNKMDDTSNLPGSLKPKSLNNNTLVRFKEKIHSVFQENEDIKDSKITEAISV